MSYTEEDLCQEENCPNLSEKGVIYCINHLHGLPRKAPIETILKYKPWLHFCGNCRLRKDGFCNNWKKEINNIRECTAKQTNK